jgi:hypothetical protein
VGSEFDWFVEGEVKGEVTSEVKPEPKPEPIVEPILSPRDDDIDKEGRIKKEENIGPTPVVRDRSTRANWGVASVREKNVTREKFLGNNAFTPPTSLDQANPSNDHHNHNDSIALNSQNSQPNIVSPSSNNTSSTSSELPSPTNISEEKKFTYSGLLCDSYFCLGIYFHKIDRTC